MISRVDELEACLVCLLTATEVELAALRDRLHVANMKAELATAVKHNEQLRHSYDVFRNKVDGAEATFKQIIAVASDPHAVESTILLCRDWAKTGLEHLK